MAISAISQDKALLLFQTLFHFKVSKEGTHTILKVKFLFKNLILTKPQRRKKWRFRTVCYTRLIWVFQTEPQTWEKMDNNWHVVSWRPQRPRRLERSPFDNFSHLGTNLKKKKKNTFWPYFQGVQSRYWIEGHLEIRVNAKVWKFEPTLQLILKNYCHPMFHVHYYISEPYGIGKRLSSVSMVTKVHSNDYKWFKGDKD